MRVDLDRDQRLYYVGIAASVRGCKFDVRQMSVYLMYRTPQASTKPALRPHAGNKSPLTNVSPTQESRWCDGSLDGILFRFPA
jgi:hypothetical protein